jgi:hypothetical protein
MNSTQCRLCLADIPHDYDHSLELTLEKGKIQDDAVTKLEIKELEPSHVPRITWPDNHALVGMAFLLMMGNCAILLIRLILLDIQESCTGCERRGLIVGVYIVTVMALVGNVFVAFLARRKFKLKGISFCCVGWVGMWLIMTIWDISMPALATKLC